MTIAEDLAPRRLEVITVYGGYRLGWAYEWKSRDGWEWSWEPVSDDATVYPTREAADGAIAARRRSRA